MRSYGCCVFYWTKGAVCEIEEVLLIVIDINSYFVQFIGGRKLDVLLGSYPAIVLLLRGRLLERELNLTLHKWFTGKYPVPF